jgi:hypothetical protein
MEEPYDPETGTYKNMNYHQGIKYFSSCNLMVMGSSCSVYDTTLGQIAVITDYASNTLSNQIK